ncbi:uncharacterized protein LOC128241365 [Mya arenaria]|uniref:uncharacterized protein LOC128241365 n=1 Tax=Mya arenaria TaxID=6604 RepID=UPI0022E1B01B|nr:uncharacterized protein LOC128241365 [Mya arenaria]
MNFTCVLQVCKDSCDETNCLGEGGWGKRKRAATRDTVVGEITATGHNLKEHQVKKRQAEVLDIDVGGRVKIVEKYSDIRVVTEETVCLHEGILIAIILLLSIGVLSFASTTFVFYRKFMNSQAQNFQNGGHINQAPEKKFSQNRNAYIYNQ